MRSKTITKFVVQNINGRAHVCENDLVDVAVSLGCCKGQASVDLISQIYLLLKLLKTLGTRRTSMLQHEHLLASLIISPSINIHLQRNNKLLPNPNLKHLFYPIS